MSELLEIGALFAHYWESEGRENTAYLMLTEDKGKKFYEVGACDREKGIFQFKKLYAEEDFEAACKTFELIVKMSQIGK